jgi:hypothetical protein
MEDTKKKSVVEPEVKEVKLSAVEAADLEIKQLELEIKRAELAAKAAELEDRTLAIAERKFNAENMQQLRDERSMKIQDKTQKSKQNGQTLRATLQGETAHQMNCTHRKGGNGIQGFMQGKGQKDDHCLMRHMLPNGDTWQRCLRCAKTWKPPVRVDFTVNGTFDEAGYKLAGDVYKAALQLSTNSITSGGTQWRFSDDGEHFRTVTRSSTLR